MKLALGELLCYAAFAVVLDRKYRRNARKRREWTNQWLLKRQNFSHVNLLKELRFHPKDWHNFLRMNESTYLTLLSMVSPLIQKEKNTTMRQSVTPYERFTATLRFLAPGRSYEEVDCNTIILVRTSLLHTLRKLLLFFTTVSRVASGSASCTFPISVP